MRSDHQKAAYNLKATSTISNSIEVKMFGYIEYQIESTMMTDVIIIAGYSPRTKDQLIQYDASKYRSLKRHEPLVREVSAQAN